jgi:3-oxoacyl-[acyl-carrier protein] reductase
VTGLHQTGAAYPQPGGRPRSGRVRINCVCPGLVDTTMTDWIRQDEEALPRWAGIIPARHIGTAAEVADVVADLASPRASYLHGAVITIDGCGSA